MTKIYESPDGGKTIREREILDHYTKEHRRRTEWYHILELSEENLVLKSAVEQCFMLYYLTRE